MKKLLLVLIIICSVGTTLFARGDSESSATGRVKEVRMWTFLNPDGANPTGRNLALRKIIDSFEASNPGVKIRVEPQQWDIMTTKFLTAHMSNSAPDIMWVMQDQMGEALAAEALEPFENLFLNEYSKEDIADFDDAFWGFGADDGNHYQISLSRNYISIMYRKDLFREKGIDENFRTYDDLLHAAKAFTEYDDKINIQRYGLGMGLAREKIDINMAMIQLLARQGSLYTPDGNANWSTPDGVAAFNMLADLIETHKVTPRESLSLTIEDVYNEFYAGKYAMIVAGSVRIPTVRSSITVCDPEDVSIMLIPSETPGKPAPTVAGGWSVGVWSGSKVKQEAGRFVEALFGPEADELWVLHGGQVPVRKSTITSLDDFFSKPENEYLKTAARGFSDAAVVVPTAFSTNGYRADFNKIIQAILLDNRPVKEAIQDVEKEFSYRNEVYK